MKHLRIKINKYEVWWEIILKDIDFLLNQNDTIALVGWNWAWKTTLMKIITWEIKEFDWFIENIWNMSLWYLSQILDINENTTVKEEIKNWFKEIVKLEQELKIYEEKMSKNDDMNIIEQYTHLLEQYNNIWWYNYENTIHQVSSWLGINHLLEKN